VAPDTVREYGAEPEKVVVIGSSVVMLCEPELVTCAKAEDGGGRLAEA
jgi:hypothetical protein